MFGISAIASAFAADKASKNKQDDPGFLVNKQSTQQPLYVVYGDREVGGHRMFVDTTNGSGDPVGTQYLHMTFAMCEGEVADIKAMRFNDKLVYINPDSNYTADYAQEVTDHLITTDATTGMVTRWRDKDADNADNDLNYATKVDMAYWLGSDDQYFESPDYNTAADMSWGSQRLVCGSYRW